MIDGFKKLPTATDFSKGAEGKEVVHPLKSVASTDWYQIFDQVDPFVASHDELEELWKNAPSRRAQDWLTGVMDTRRMIAVVTGIKF